MDLDRARQTYIIEARELLDSMEDALLTLEQQSDPQEAINSMFRAVHTIKGSAGLFGLDGIVHFAHTVESVLDRVRSRQLMFGADLVGLMLEAHDHLAELIANLQSDAPERAATRSNGERILARLQPYLGAGLARAEAPSLPAALEPRAGSSGRDCWHLSIRFSPDVLRNGMDPLSFVRYLGTMGEIVHLTSILGTLPEREAFDPRNAGWAWRSSWTPRPTGRPSRTSSNSSGRAAGSG